MKAVCTNITPELLKTLGFRPVKRSKKENPVPTWFNMPSGCGMLVRFRNDRYEVQVRNNWHWIPTVESLFTVIFHEGWLKGKEEKLEEIKKVLGVIK